MILYARVFQKTYHPSKQVAGVWLGTIKAQKTVRFNDCKLSDNFLKAVSYDATIRPHQFLN